jgi:hypothetical protein
MGKNPSRARIGLSRERLNGRFFVKNAHTSQFFEAGDDRSRVGLPGGDWTRPRACYEDLPSSLPLEVEEAGKINIRREGNTLHIKLIQVAASVGNEHSD